MLGQNKTGPRLIKCHIAVHLSRCHARANRTAQDPTGIAQIAHIAANGAPATKAKRGTKPPRFPPRSTTPTTPACDQLTGMIKLIIFGCRLILRLGFVSGNRLASISPKVLHVGRQALSTSDDCQADRGISCRRCSISCSGFPDQNHRGQDSFRGGGCRTRKARKRVSCSKITHVPCRIRFIGSA